MAQQQSVIEIPGYASQQTDFATHLATVSPNVVQFLEDEFVQPMFDAEGAGDFGTPLDQRSWCSVLVVGHADRYDVSGATPEQRRAIELENSQKRAASASEWLLNRLADRLQAANATIPADWGSTVNVVMRTVACGSADLKNLVPANEDERKENRRVELSIAVFRP
jgi:flagellar motor protein MotB